ncbi:uncharacterized protein LOC119472016 isoform X2 [Cebus imitator]|nr:uncharacterized protein LOC119472016 isoform X2 [Cebus imitator]
MKAGDPRWQRGEGDLEDRLVHPPKRSWGLLPPERSVLPKDHWGPRSNFRRGFFMPASRVDRGGINAFSLEQECPRETQPAGGRTSRRFHGNPASGSERWRLSEPGGRGGRSSRLEGAQLGPEGLGRHPQPESEPEPETEL